DALFGLGLGCEGAVRVILLPLNAQNGWQPLARFAVALAAHVPAEAHIVIGAPLAGTPVGTLLPSLPRPSWNIEVLTARLALPPRLLQLGAGPDAVPLAHFASQLGWEVTVYDHRPAYAQRRNFPSAHAVHCAPAGELARIVDLAGFEA